jgi:hypothetical protein
MTLRISLLSISAICCMLTGDSCLSGILDFVFDNSEDVIAMDMDVAERVLFTCMFGTFKSYNWMDDFCRVYQLLVTWPQSVLFVFAHTCLFRVKERCSCRDGPLHFLRYCGTLSFFQWKSSDSIAANNSSSTPSCSFTSSMRYGSWLTAPQFPSGSPCSSKSLF